MCLSQENFRAHKKKKKKKPESEGVNSGLRAGGETILRRTQMVEAWVRVGEGRHVAQSVHWALFSQTYF